MEKFIRKPRPDWFPEEGVILSEMSVSDKQRLLDELLMASQNHCAYTDILFEDDFDIENRQWEAVIDTFLPKKRNADTTFQWDCFFPIARKIKRLKSFKEDRSLLKPDEDDYEFDKYFVIDYHNGLLSPNPDASEANRHRAEVTIEVMALNTPALVQDRKDEADVIISMAIDWAGENPGTITLADISIDLWSYRFMIPQILKDFSDKNKMSYVHQVDIQNFYCLQNIKLEGLGEKKEVYFLGENGDGKTLILQALVLLFEQNYVSINMEKSDAGEMLDMLKNLSARPAFYINEKKEEEIGKRWLRNLFAYGVSRNNTQGDFDKYGFLTLFDKKKILQNPTDWLLKIRLEELEKDYRGITVKQAIELLENLTDHNLKISIKGSKVHFKERGADIGFRHLSEGYRSILIWVTDLVARLSERQPRFQTIEYPDGGIGYDFKGVVLVDEINLHLHPKWEYKIVRKLRKWFPNLQFFFTTHSPVTALGASDDAVFYRMYKDEYGTSSISEPYFAKEMGGWLANVLITSPLFDMESARAAFFGEDDVADTADDSLTSQIRKAVKAEAARIKKEEGKPYFSRETLQKMIDQALQNAKNNP